MKTIRLLGTALMTVLISVCFISCSGDDYSSPLKGQIVNNQVFESGSSSISITIGNEDLSGCTISSSAKWCTSTIKGSVVSVSVLSNDTYEERRATITITDPEDGTNLSFQVLQKQNNGIFVDKNSFDIPEEGGEITIKISSNVNYKVELPAEGWITQINRTRALYNSDLNLKVAKNISGYKREGTIKIIDKETGIYANVLVKQDFIPKIEIDSESINVDGYGGDIKLNVQSNVDVDNIYSDDDWIMIGEKVDMDGFNFSVNISISSLISSGGNRSGHVYFKSSKNALTKTITVDQVGVDEIINIDGTTITTDYKSKDVYLVLTANTDFSISSPSWVSLTMSSKKQSDNIHIYKYIYKVSISSNNSMEDRRGYIIFKSKSTEVRVTVDQSGIQDISELVSCSTRILSYVSGYFGNLYATSTITNNSPFTIYLTSAKMKTYSHILVNKYYDSTPLLPGKSTSIDYNNSPPYDLSIEGLTCTWTYTYNNKSYSVTER